ncbi:SWIM zinc finger family protein [Haloarcula sp. S1AR25-5A]|uniref:SWIM zinc finger family protein n=1 Tax=Haloarcula terrestris TaxID=2950533 RepID=A0AAE4JHL8_9EURY|nr:SWIM zinc finger family protein [Haloarcula terrestris]MDS0221675.1 SWIM zinc finger family protein [Haloarcula terrestris]
MNLSTEQIRALCTSEVFDRARNYHDEDRIERIDRFDETMSAAVQGSQPEPYSVEIERSGDEPENVDASCTCPYDWGGYCKHIIAVLLELAEGDIALEDEREAVERVLSDAHPEELREFLLDECERDAELRRRLLTRFEAQDTQSLYDYKKEMSQQYRGPYTYRYEGPDFSEFHDLAETHREQGNPLEAATIYRAMTEVRIENMEMVQDYYGEDFETELDAFVECIREADLDHEEKREYIDYLFERWGSDDSALSTFSGQYEDALWEFCTADADLQYWRDRLEDDLPAEIPETSEPDDGIGSFDTRRYEAERRIKTYAEVLDSLGDTETLREVYEEYYLDIREFCVRYARLLATEGEGDQSIEVAEEGLNAFSNVRELRRFLIDAYADRDPKRHKELLREQFLQSGDWEYYKQLRSHCSDNKWESVVADIEARFEDSNVRRLIDLYLREERMADAFETVIEAAREEPDDAFQRAVGDNGLAIQNEYRDDVADYDPETYYEVYEERLEPFLADTTGRDHYQTVVEYLEEMRELGFDDEFEAFVAHLKEKHSNRPAFLDEIKALEH